MRMASGKKKNPVNAYLNKVNIKKQDNLKNLLTDIYGEDGARNLRGAFETIRMKIGKDNNRTELYDFINSDYDFSMLMSSFQDGDIIRNTCAWLNSIRGEFGPTVLDVGCGNGIITCFLATILPNSTFLAVDRSANAIAVAKQLRTSLNLQNIMFMNCDYKKLEGKKFDTVLASRIMDENCIKEECRFLPFSRQVETLKNQYLTAATALSTLVDDGGNLICIERDRNDVSTLALLDLFRRDNLALSKFQLFTCREGDLKDLDTYTAYMTSKSPAPISYSRLFSQWSSMYFPGMGNDGYMDAEADYMLELCETGSRQGYTTSHPISREQTGMFFLCDYKGRDDFFMLYQKNEAHSRLGIFPMAQKTQAVALLKEDMQNDSQGGYVITAMGLN